VWPRACSGLCLGVIRRSESRKDRKLEYINKDPKDGELYLERIKSGETLMEVRSDTNVQIVRHI